VLYLQRFNAQRLSGDLQAALDGLAEARQRYPQEARFYSYPAQILIQAGQPLGALPLVHQAIEAGLPQSGLENVAGQLLGVAVEAYVHNQVVEARQILEPLSSWLPGNAWIMSAAAYVLTGEGRLDEAEKLLRQAMAVSSPSDEVYSICLCDVGYIQLLRGLWDAAVSSFQEVLQVVDYERAFLRIAFWHRGRMIPDYKAHPTRSVSTHWGAKANLVALALAQQNLEHAQQVAVQLHEHTQQACTSNMILGCVALAKGNDDIVRIYWGSARDCAGEQGEVDLIQHWLEELPDNG